jgi:hypothetical protein
MKGQTHGGKGSTQRKTDSKKFAKNYDAIFGKKNCKEEIVMPKVGNKTYSYTKAGMKAAKKASVKSGKPMKKGKK